MIMARRCVLEGMKVLGVAEVLPYPSGLVRNRVQCLDDYNIPLYLRHTIIDIRGKERVEGVSIAQIDDRWRPIPGTEKYFDCDTILFSVGLIPENELTIEADCEIARNGGPNVDEYLQTTIPGIFACGNVLQVHDLVDWVTEEAERAGENARLFASGALHTPDHDGKRSIKIIPGNNVGYIVPERVDVLTTPKKVQFSFRVKDPHSNIIAELVSNGRVIYSRRKKFALPSEMIHISPKLNPELIGENITINVIEQDRKINIIEKSMMEDI
jgi:hypothetical protein